MAYKIIVSPRALKEIENAIEYYSLSSVEAPKRFVISLDEAYNFISEAPFRRVVYKSVRALKLKRFPYLLYFVVDEIQKKVKVLACFHSKRNPDKRPLY
jgi:plasmid stabilization system protein ParE